MTPPPPTEQEKKLRKLRQKEPRKIEIVDTPDCTSIDTTIPEDELFANQARKKSYLEMVTEARELANNDRNDKSDEFMLTIEDGNAASNEWENLHAQLSSQGNSSIGSGEVSSGTNSKPSASDKSEPGHKDEGDAKGDSKEASEYIDDVFKPVFSIA